MMTAMTLWPAPTATRRVDGRVAVPGSKSLTARALVLAWLAEAPTRLHSPLVARDTRLMADALTALGATVDARFDGPWELRPGRPSGPREVECGLAGTVMRFVPPLAVLTGVPVRFDGDPRARERPLGGLLDALRRLGASTDPAHAAALPVTVQGGPAVTGGTLEVDASASSQVVSALLLAGCRFPEGLLVRPSGHVPSRAHVQMTLATLRARGVDVVERADGSWQVAPGVPSGGDVAIEPDLSNAAVFLAAALVTGGRVQVPGWPDASLQPVAAVRRLVEAFGGTATLEAGTLTVTGGERVHGLGRVDLGEVGELAPTVAALAALADGPSTLTGIRHLRGHETDRLAALAREIRGLGGRAEETGDGVHVEPTPLHGGVVRTYADHRMATFAAIVGLAVPGVVVEDVAATAKTMPQFPALWSGLVA
jgi:3-phosphoshikimate 1-carboxyvinyltransferase